MAFIANENIIIIYGGKNDLKTNKECFPFRDAWAYTL